MIVGETYLIMLDSEIAKYHILKMFQRSEVDLLQTSLKLD
jgi:hypothetical protein